MTYRIRVAPTVLCLIFGAAGPLHAQDECKLDEPGAWWATRQASVQRNSTSAADRAIMEPLFRAAEAIVRKTSLATPRGFAIRPWWAYGDITNRGRLSGYGVWFVSFFRCNKYDEHSAHIAFDFNPGPQAWSEGDRPMRDENGDGLYTEHARAEPLFGSTATYGHIEEENTQGLFLLFTRGGESPTIPVTREEHLRAIIFSLEPKGPTSYEKWMKQAPDRKKGREETVAVIAASDPVRAEQLRKDLEKAERDNTELLRQRQAEGDSAWRIVLDRYRAQIAAMTPAERASPAVVQGLDLVPAGSPNAHAIVRANPAFYRAGQSPVEPRIVLVTMPNAYKELKDQHRQLYRELDWAAVKRLLKE